MGFNYHLLLCSKNFAETLQRVGVKAEAILYEGKTHTDLFLQVRDHFKCFLFSLFHQYVAFVDWRNHWGDYDIFLYL
jgi:hypothetical protein